MPWIWKVQSSTHTETDRKIQQQPVQSNMDFTCLVVNCLVKKIDILDNKKPRTLMFYSLTLYIGLYTVCSPKCVEFIVSKVFYALICKKQFISKDV